MMQRYDLRHLKDEFYDKMVDILNASTPEEVVIFMFEVGDFTPVQKSADVVKQNGHELLNSLKYNEVDWTIVVKRKA